MSSCVLISSHEMVRLMPNVVADPEAVSDRARVGNTGIPGANVNQNTGTSYLELFLHNTELFGPLRG